VTAPSTSIAVRETPAVPTPAATEPDIDAQLIPGLSKLVECRDRDLPAEAKEVCTLLERFRHGKPFIPVVASTAAVLGVAYSVDANGRLEERYYDVVVGNGRPWELGLFPLRAFTGVEDFETQAIIDSQRAGQKPPENEVLARIRKHPRPTAPSIAPTQGKSLVMSVLGGRKVYFRQDGARWLLLGVRGKTLDDQLRGGFAIAVVQ
jgi:hypothetical protein